MSRAAETVETSPRRGPAFVPQAAANVRSAASRAVHWAVVTGSGSAERYASMSASQRTGVLRPTPRGSKPTMSKRSRMAAGKIVVASCRTKSTPDPPGPPGLVTSEPMRRARSVAGSRMRLMWATAGPPAA